MGKSTTTTMTAKDVKATWRDTEDEARVPTDIPTAAEAVPLPHESIAGKNLEDETVAGAEDETVTGAEVGRAGPGPGPGPPRPTRRRPEAEDRTVEDTIPPVEDGTGAQTDRMSSENSLVSILPGKCLN